VALPVLIVGRDGLGRSVADAIAHGARAAVAGFIDEFGPEVGKVLGSAVFGCVSKLALRDCHSVMPTIGGNARPCELSRLARARCSSLPRRCTPGPVSRHGGAAVASTGAAV
jgi:hypothetical protein